MIYLVFFQLPPLQMFVGSLLPEALREPFWFNAILYTVPIIASIAFYGKEAMAIFSYFKSKTMLKIFLVILGFGLVLLENFVVTSIPGMVETTQNQDVMEQAGKSVPLLYSVLCLEFWVPLWRRWCFVTH